MKNTQYNFNSPSFTFNPSQSLRSDVKGVLPTQHITKIPEFNSSIFNPPQHTIKADFKDTSHTQHSFNISGAIQPTVKMPEFKNTQHTFKFPVFEEKSPLKYSARCSFTKPNSLIQGCLDSLHGMKDTAGDMALTGGWIAHAGVQAVGKKLFPGPAMAGALAIEAVGYCAYSAINAAQDNINATCDILTISDTYRSFIGNRDDHSSVPTDLMGHSMNQSIFDYGHH